MESLHGLTLDFQGSSQKHFLPFGAPANTNPHLKEQRICSAALPLRDPATKALIFHRDTVRSAPTAALCEHLEEFKVEFKLRIYIHSFIQLHPQIFSLLHVQVNKFFYIDILP